MSLGIAAVGAYAPDLRVSADEFAEAWGSFEASGIEEKAVPDADEDALTMAVEAANRTLDAGEVGAAALDGIFLASTTPPLAEEETVTRLATILGASDDATLQQFGASTRAGTRALFAALDADAGPTLVVASDCPKGSPETAQEHAAGAGAAAFLLDDSGAATITDRAEFAVSYPGTRFREQGSEDVESIDITPYERAAFSEALAGAVDQVEAGDVDAAAVQSPDGKLPYRATGAVGVDAETIHTCATVQDIGDTGAASVPLSVATALADGADRILGAAYGSGAGADALVVEGGDVPTDLALEGDTDLSYGEYLRRRGDVTGDGPNGGAAYVSVPTWKRSMPQRHRLIAGRCPECGALAFPPEGACPDCLELVEYEPVRLPSSGTVEAATSIGRGGAPPEFAVQQQQNGAFGVVIAAFEADGDEVSMPLQVAGDPDLAVGDTVETVVRRIYTQEGVTRYGRKAVPGND
jgi:hydroxymethylglutaryl-CoA synthase